jgi:hypothetical protein
MARSLQESCDYEKNTQGQHASMKYRKLEYARTFNLGNYESEKITLKAAVLRLQTETGKTLESSKKAVETDKRLESVKKAFSQDLAALLVFEEKKDAVIIRPKEFLGSANFAKISSVVRELKGEYVSAGKDSHFKILR